MVRNHRGVLGGIAAIFLAVHGVNAAGFQRPKGSAAGLGRANSGEAAIADDASILASNPAGLLLLPEGLSVSTGLVLIPEGIDFDGSAFTPGEVVVGGDGVLESAFLPYFYGAYQMSERWSVGLGIFSNYGFDTNYQAGAQLTDSSELTTWNISPAIAYRVNDSLTLGGGIDFVFGETELTSTSVTPTRVRILDLDGDGWGVGINVGVLWEISERTRAGLHYRSQVDLEMDGRGRFDTPGLMGSAETDVTLPDTLEFSIYHKLTNRVAVHGDVIWTNWEDFDKLAPSIGGTTAFTITHDWEDAFRFAVGATWEATDKLTIRIGAAYDETPVSGRNSSVLRIPDSSVYWLSAGLSYEVLEGLRIDAGYTRHLQDDAQYDERVKGNGNFKGETEGHIDLFAFGVSGTF